MLLAIAAAVFAQTITMTPEEARLGFVPLALDRWRGFRQDHVPQSWTAEGNELRVAPGKPGGDLMTIDQFVNFDFRLDWKISKGGNSGIIYRSSEDEEASYYTGPEYQLLDDANNGDGQNPLTSSGSAYAVYPPTQKVVKPFDEWNSSRIVAKGNHVQHYLNGVLVVDYELKSPEWKELVAKSKFGGMDRYGMERVGHIVLQDHGYKAEFRNIRVRRL
ncbi:DUF1080 domain-containing protein [soil metagenome]